MQNHGQTKGTHCKTLEDTRRHWLDAIDPPLERHLEVLVSTIEKFLSDNTPETSDEK
jgi:hypothetical protein